MGNFDYEAVKSRCEAWNVEDDATDIVRTDLATALEEIDRLNHEIMGYQTRDGYEKGYENGCAVAGKMAVKFRHERDTILVEWKLAYGAMQRRAHAWKQKAKELREQIKIIDHALIKVTEDRARIAYELTTLRTAVNEDAEVQRLVRENRALTAAARESHAHAQNAEDAARKLRLQLLSIEGQCIEEHHWKGNCPAEPHDPQLCTKSYVECAQCWQAKEK